MEHTPVLLDECIGGLNINTDGIYVDGTLGRGGHSREIAKRLKTGKLVAIDRDAAAVEEAKEQLFEFRDKIEFVQGNFSDIREILNVPGYTKISGMLFDLGVSSPQLDEGARGFSYMKDAALDMRMDTQRGETAFDAVNYWQEEKLRKVFYEYGE